LAHRRAGARAQDDGARHKEAGVSLTATKTAASRGGADGADREALNEEGDEDYGHAKFPKESPRTPKPQFILLFVLLFFFFIVIFFVIIFLFLIFFVECGKIVEEGEEGGEGQGDGGDR